jgi:hypothetical protein
VDELDFAGGTLPDDDPEIIAGLERLRLLRQLDENVRELRREAT